MDSDGDGMSNYAEYVAGTNPTNNLSYLKIDSLVASGGALISFGIISNKTYTVQFADTPGGAWSKLADVASRGTNATETVLDPGYVADRFYRLVVPRQP